MVYRSNKIKKNQKTSINKNVFQEKLSDICINLYCLNKLFVFTDSQTIIDANNPIKMISDRDLLLLVIW